VVADVEGRLGYVPGNSKPGSHVDLRAEMNVLVVLNSCPHPFDPSATYPLRNVKLVLSRTSPPGRDDLVRTSRPENERGFANTERYFI
jgi:uncharacterized protein YcgI (DUF1989 family)